MFSCYEKFLCGTAAIGGSSAGEGAGATFFMLCG
jgi:hypothetical protein